MFNSGVTFFCDPAKKEDGGKVVSEAAVEAAVAIQCYVSRRRHLTALTFFGSQFIIVLLLKQDKG